MRHGAGNSNASDGHVGSQSHIREWILCKGNNLQVADIEMKMQEEALSNVMACTLPHNITTLCCMDFTKLAFTENIALEFAVTPMQNETDKEDKVMICTSKRPKIPRLEPGSIVQINEKLECQGMMYAMSDIRNGTAFFDSGIEWFVEQDVHPQSIETCRELIRKCPHGTELAGMLPNSASDKVLSGLLTASEVVAFNRRGGGGFLTTQGSFTLSSGSGSNQGTGF